MHAQATELSVSRWHVQLQGERPILSIDRSSLLVRRPSRQDRSRNLPRIYREWFPAERLKPRSHNDNYLNGWERFLAGTERPQLVFDRTEN
jgi:hypothetical protein